MRLCVFFKQTKKSVSLIILHFKSMGPSRGESFRSCVSGHQLRDLGLEQMNQVKI